MNDLSITSYTPADADEWNTFIAEKSRNGHFMFNRSYCDYHADRFVDHSFIFRKNGIIAAILPGHLKDGGYASHLGLTFGGLIVSSGIGIDDAAECFDLLVERLRSEECRTLIYRPVPHHYHLQPTEDDLFLLMHAGARLTARHLSTVLEPANRPARAQLRIRGAKKAQRAQISCKKTSDLSAFWTILEDRLGERYDSKPVHSLDEIRLLSKNFPDAIVLQGAFEGSTMVAGAVLYLSTRVAHIQYIASSRRGREIGAQDLLTEHLISAYSTLPYFDLGRSTHENGSVANTPLISVKEGFGGRSIVYDTWELDIQNAKPVRPIFRTPAK